MNEIASTGAALARGRSKQDYGTPADFLARVVERFGPLAWDLAATAENAKAPRFFTPEEDSLAQDWTKLSGNLWLNPPFDRVEPWAAKCAAARGFRWDDRRVLMLTRASVGSMWFDRHVHGHALVLALVGRIRFDRCENDYPADLILSVYGEVPRFDTWSWG